MLITVILPVYKVENYIGACIQSLLKQSYKDFDIVLVNDGSPDRSIAIAKDLLSSQTEIHYQVITQENRGVSAARNTGLKRARGKYVIMVDADDVLAPSFLFDFYNQSATHPDNHIFSCSFSVVNEMNAHEFSAKEDSIEELSYAHAQTAFFDRRIKFLLPALMIRLSFLQDNGIYFDEAVRYSEDVQFIWRCLAYNRMNIIHMKAKNYNYVLHGGSTMTASGIEKILTFCGGMKRLDAEIHNLFCEPVKSQLMSRMYFSMIHGAAKMLQYQDFRTLYTRSNCNVYILEQAKKGNMRLRLVTACMIISKKLGYEIMRKF